MTARIGPHGPDSETSYFGPPSNTILNTRLGSGDLVIGPVSVAGTQTAITRSIGSGAIVIRPPQIELIPIQITRRRGPGDIVMPAPAVESDGGTVLGRPSGYGEITSKVIVQGTGTRNIGVGNQYDIDGALTARVVVAGDAFISQRYITGSGDLFIGAVVVHDTDNPVTPDIFDLQGVFTEHRDLEGVMVDFIELEGVGSA